MSAAKIASIQITVDDCKNPNKPWFCMNEPCENFLGLEKQKNVRCWHFCPSCLQKKDKIITDSKYRLSRIVNCSYCFKMFCLDCTNFTLNRQKNSRCLTCQKYPEKPNEYDSPIVKKEDKVDEKHVTDDEEEEHVTDDEEEEHVTDDEEEEHVTDEGEFIPEMIFEHLSSFHRNFAEEA